MWQSIKKSITFKDIIYVFIIIGISIFFWLHKGVTAQDLTNAQYKYDSLNKVNQQKMDSVFNFFNEKVDSAIDKINNAYVEISKNDKKINDLEKAHKKQDDIIDHYDVDQLQHLLSNY